MPAVYLGKCIRIQLVPHEAMMSYQLSSRQIDCTYEQKGTQYMYNLIYIIYNNYNIYVYTGCIYKGK